MIKNIIFDMDGVISDTQKLHSKIEAEILNRFGVNLTSQEITEKYAGIRTKIFFNELLKNQNKSYNINTLIQEKWEKMTKLSQLGIDEIPGSSLLIETLSKANFSLAVASASNNIYVNRVLETLKVKKFFKAIVSGDMVKKGKPDPESFTLAADLLKANYKNCLVIEDGVSGMQAAKSAGMKCIGLTIDKNKKYPTKNLVTSLDEITIEYIKSL